MPGSSKCRVNKSLKIIDSPGIYMCTCNKENTVPSVYLSCIDLGNVTVPNMNAIVHIHVHVLTINITAVHKH